MAFIWPAQQWIYSVFNLQDLKFSTRVHLGLSHLNEHRFRHNFKDWINPLGSCILEVENTLYFFLPCQHYSTFRVDLMNKVNQIDENFSYLSEDNKVSLLLYDDSRFDDNKNNFILSASITYILKTARFLTFFVKLHKSLLLIANVFKGVASGLWKFSAIESA